MNVKRIWVGALALALLAAIFAIPNVQLAGGMTERLTNGDFEAGFYQTPAGFVGNGWQWFNTGGQAAYGYYDETWTPVIYDGLHSQLLEINTFARGESDADRYSGIYQTVAVTPGEVYELSIRGMLRAWADDPDRDNYGYRVQYGVDYSGGTDWTAVTNWVELPWDTIYDRLAPGAMDSYTAEIKATGSRLTLFVRAWKKWGTVNRELDVNLDAISLVGSMPADKAKPGVSFIAPKFPVVGWSYAIAVNSSNDVGIIKLEFYDGATLVGSVSYDVGMLSLSHGFTWTPATVGTHTLKVVAFDAAGAKAAYSAKVTVGKEGQFLASGDFEGGFHAIPPGNVGNSWGWFNNDGQATYGYYDETWTPVVYDGLHSQMLEINTFSWGAADPDRYSGIYQTVTGLTPGATYHLSLYGMLRVRGDDPDREGYNYRVQWGYDPAGGTDWTAVTNWVEIPWDTVYDRLAPGDMEGYASAFEAPSKKITVFIRAWKKWGTTERELDVNLDGITLSGYRK
jgi:hypothetical protein